MRRRRKSGLRLRFGVAIRKNPYGPPQPAPNRRAWKPEIVATLMLALPLVLSNLAQIAMTVTDVMFIGRLGSQQLAASALGANLYSAIAFFALGLVSATAPMAARAGARRNAVRDVRLTVRQGLWTAVLISLPGCLALWHGEQILLLLRQPPELAALAGEYLRALLWAMPPFLGFLVLRSFLAALQNRAGPSSWRWPASRSTCSATGCWCSATWARPPWAWSARAWPARWPACACSWAWRWVLRDRRFRRYRLFGNLLQPDWQRLAAFWKLVRPSAWPPLSRSPSSTPPPS